LFGAIKPSVIVGGFDGIHGSLALAVSRRMNIPWYALQFSVIPAGLAGFCDQMTPAARVSLNPLPLDELKALASASLRDFEQRRIQAPAYIAPPQLPLAGKIARLPQRLRALQRTVRNSRSRRCLQFTEAPPYYSVPAAIGYFRRAARSRKALFGIRALKEPPAFPYVLFGLHMQPEVSTDVWAPYFSNQLWVIELLSRSIPATHKLMVKVHKSDIANYSPEQYAKMQSFPGVELVAPFADTRDFIEKADLIVSIQGTMGLEAALIGKPVIMLGDSPFVIFPSVSRIGELTDLPSLMREKLAASPPSHAKILDAYAAYLTPYLRASYNDWRLRITEEEIDHYVLLFDALKRYVADGPAHPLS
jgi:Capsule polysaccharide biosynthesis protein